MHIIRLLNCVFRLVIPPSPPPHVDGPCVICALIASAGTIMINFVANLELKVQQQHFLAAHNNNENACMDNPLLCSLLPVMPPQPSYDPDCPLNLGLDPLGN